MERVVLHSDLNSFYASVEGLYNPELNNLPVAVCGDPEARHGIVLTKNQHAKKFGVMTAQPIWQAKQCCPGLVVVRPHYDRYMRFSQLVKDIYYEYTDQVEPFGLDECWLDVTGSVGLFGNGEKIANNIRKRIFSELGLTASVGVSFNKIFAKLGSDMKKPDATTVITQGNFKNKIWPLPAGDLLYVGHATALKLNKFNIKTIGDLANADIKILHAEFGKSGIVLKNFANGCDRSEVARAGTGEAAKSIGNSTTTPRDLVCDNDVWLTVLMLSESVASRLRESGLKCSTVQMYIRDKYMSSCDIQAKFKTPTFISMEIAQKAMEIFKKKYNFRAPVRTLGVRGCDLSPECIPVQLSLFGDGGHEKLENAERAIDSIRSRFGHYSIQRGVMLLDKQMSAENPKDHVNPFSIYKLTE